MIDALREGWIEGEVERERVECGDGRLRDRYEVIHFFLLLLSVLPAGMSCAPLTVNSNTYCNTRWVAEILHLNINVSGVKIRYLLFKKKTKSTLAKRLLV